MSSEGNPKSSAEDEEPLLKSEQRKPDANSVMPKRPPSQLTRLSAAALYGSSSLAIIFTNKIALTTYQFPSFKALALCQCLITVVLLGALLKNGIIEFTNDGNRSIFSLSDARAIFPLPLLFFGNLLCGLGGTKSINIAMFTALRRFSILMMMLLEMFVLGENFTTPVKISVGVVVMGGVVAALNDLAFDLWGYMLVMGNNVFGALYGVTTKSKLNGKNLTKFGLLYYNSICAIPILALTIAVTEPQIAEKLRNYEFWREPQFLVCLIGSMVLGVVLNYAVFWCTQVNSATTTALVGSMKNVISAYAAILGVGGDYVFSMANFVGLNISMAGACLYSYFKLLAKKNKGAGGQKSDSKSQNRNGTGLKQEP